MDLEFEVWELGTEVIYICRGCGSLVPDSRTDVHAEFHVALLYTVMGGKGLDDPCEGEHLWPDELDADKRCARCGLRYSQWSMEG